MKLVNLKVNQLENPLGYDFSFLTLSWQVESTESDFINAVRIKIWTESEENPCHDTGIQKDFQGNKYYVKMKLLPRTRYYWNLWVKGDRGDQTASEAAWFETGKQEEPWKAKWISTQEDTDRMPFLYREFFCDSNLKQARLYLYGLGLYEAYLNEEKVGEEYLTPGYHSYDLRMEYQTYDVTGQLSDGKNTIGILLGEGWYKGRFGFDGDFSNIYGERKKCICELYLRYEDGREECIVTDETWEAVQSNVGSNNIYDGESLDATAKCEKLEVKVLPDDKKLLTERTNVPVCKTESFSPVKKTWQQDGTLLLDFGEAITGWVEWSGKLQYSQKVRLQYGEVLQNDHFYRDNLRTAKAEFNYVSAGADCTVRPHFTFYGFRYVQVTGVKPEDTIDFTAYRLMSAIHQTGWIHTSDEKVNILLENTRRSQKCNFLDIPTDCPQRDERMGWTGDVAVFAPTACFHENCSVFFRHYMKSLRDEQKLNNGEVHFFVPRMKIPDGEKRNPFYGDGCASGWGDVATILPWTLYLYYGDKQLLAEQYPVMCDWVDYMVRQSSDNPVPYLWQSGRHLGDWLALDNANIYNPIGKTDTYLISSAYFYYSALLCSYAAGVLEDERLEEWCSLAEHIKKAFLAYYFNGKGELTVEPTQTACALLLEFGLYSTEGKSYLTATLKRLLEENEGLLNTGFLGTPVLCPALSENGENKLAYSLLLNEKYPGWLYEVNMGSTTVWERWNSLEEDGTISGTGMNSLNHYAYGCIAGWMYRYMCGFRPQMNEKICMVLQPMPDERFTEVSGYWETSYGRFRSGWKYDENGKVYFQMEIPCNAKAKVIFPNEKSCVLSKGKYCFDENGMVIR